MQQRKQLYDKAKRDQSKEAWAKYRKPKNEIIKEINQGHECYQNNLFDSQVDTHHKKFWRCIKKLHKDQTGVTSLTMDDSFSYLQG